MIKTFLTPKEQECLHWVALGKTTDEISDILSISPHTVNFHLRNACTKLNARNRPAAIAKAIYACILKPP